MVSMRFLAVEPDDLDIPGVIRYRTAGGTREET